MSNTKRVLSYIDEGFSEHEAYEAVIEENILRMPLIKRIEKIIDSSNNGCIDIEFLTSQLNDYKFHKPNIKHREILIEILKYPNVFIYLNGLIIITSNKYYYKIKKSYNYIKNNLTPYFNKSDIQYIVGFLFFYKRLSEHERHDLIDLNLNSFMLETDRENLLVTKIKEFHTNYNFEINLADDFINYIKNIKFEILGEIFHILEQLDTMKYSDSEFGKIYEHLIDKDIEHNFTNKSMQQLMLRFFELEDNATILNPFGGLGGLVIESIQNNSNIYLEYNEINKRTLQLGLMSLYMYGKFNIKFNCEDSFLSYRNEKKYDYLITELPLARKFTESELSSNSVQRIRYNNPIGPITSKESILYYIIYTLSKINDSGKSIFNVPTGFLFYASSDYIKVRKYLIENDFIEAIINLPSGTMYHSGINTSLLLINFNKYAKNKIKIINAQLLHEAKTKNREITNETILDIDSILDSYQHETKDSFFINTEKISKKDYRLDSSIFQKEIFQLHYALDEGKAKYLKDLAVIKKGKNFNKDQLSSQGEFPVVKIQNLNNDVVDLYLNDNDTFDRLQHVSSRDIICEECILIASVGEQIKPTIFRPTNKLPNIFITTNIIALIPKDTVSIEYLYYQIYSKIVIEQVKNLTSGSIRTFLTIKSAGELIIPYVELKEQQSYTDIQKSSIIASQRAELETKLKLMGYKEELESRESDIVMTLTHQLRPILSNLYFEAQNLKDIIHSNNLEKQIDKNIVMPTDPEAKKPKINTLGEVAQIIYLDSKKLHDSLDIIDRVMSFKLKQTDFKSEDLYSFFEDYVNKQRKNYDITLKGENFNVEFNDKAFTELLDQLLLNAERHAFIDTLKYKINFHVKKNKKQGIAVIEYYNNGKKFDVSRDNYINAFERKQGSKGSGIGGNLIYRIIKAHQGELYIQDSEDGFKFYIEIPLKQNLEDKE